MSLENTKQVIDRAMTDADFLELLFNNPTQALQGYELNESEITMFQGLSTGPYGHVNRGLQEIKKLIQAAEDFSLDDGEAKP